MGIHVGDHVLADFGDGYVIAHISEDAHDNDAGETKYGVQKPDGTVVDLTHREASDIDDAGTNGTFKKV